MIYPESKTGDTFGKSTLTQIPESLEGAKCLNHILGILEQVMIHLDRDGPRSPLYANFNLSCPTVNHLVFFRNDVGIRFVTDRFSSFINLFGGHLTFTLISMGSFSS